MNTKLLIGIGVVVLIIAVILVIVLPKKDDNNDNKKNTKEIEITREINAGIPFKWEYEIKDKDIVEFSRSYVLKDDNTGGKVGASVYTNYVFKGLKEGTTTITFRVVSITGEYEPTNEETYKINVDKDLNISIVNE